MIQLLNIHLIGYTANNNPNRARRSGEELEGFIPAPTWHEEIVKRNADVSQTVSEMIKLIRDSVWQTKRLSERLLDKDLYTTCSKIWDFLFSHILYKEDDKGKEQLRTPALSWYLRRTRGIDCDDFSIFASTILYNLNIPHYLRIAKYRDENGNPKDYFQHVYVVVPQKSKNYITIDAVLDEFDSEKATVETKDFLVMNKSNLNGIDVSVLSGIADENTQAEISGILSGLDFDPIKELEGLEGLGNSEELEGLEGEDGEVILGAIRSHLIRTREAIRNNPAIISTVEDPHSFGAMLDYGLRYWDTEHQETALGILADKEDQINTLLGLGDLSEETQLFYGIEGLSGVSVLGKAKAKKQFFNNVKKTVSKVKESVKKTASKTGTGLKAAAKKTGQGAKKVGQKAKTVAKKVAKVIIKTNPVSVSARLGLLAAMKTNFLKIASKIKWGYLTESEARKHGFDLAEWKKSKDALTKTEKLFVNTLKGNADALKKAILTGRAGGLNGINEELGVVVAAAAGTSMAAAMPFIKQIVEFVKLINPAKLISDAKSKKLSKDQKAAETMPDVSDEAESAQPDAPASLVEESPTSDPEETNTENTPESTPEENSQARQSSQTNQSNESSSASQDEPIEKTETMNTTNSNNLPATTPSTDTTKPTTTTGETGPIAKVFNWVKENPGKTALITATGLLLILGAKSAMSDKPRTSLGKKGRGKIKKGKKKNNPPRAISGTGKKSKYKNYSRKGKGGGPKKVTL